MGRTWVLETHTKGTGANMVPLDDRRDSAPGEPPFPVPRAAERPVEASVPKPPPRFRVVDVLTGRVLADDASTRETVVALGGVRSVVDVKVYLWHHADERWRMLTQREQRALWAHRRPAAAAASG